MKKLKMRGRVWEFVRERIEGGARGMIDAPNKPGKRIRIAPHLKDREELYIIIHELLHAGSWDMDEEAVDAISDDMATALWRIGYRKQDEKA